MSEQNFERVMKVAGIIILIALAAGYLRFLGERDDRIFRIAECASKSEDGLTKATYRACDR